MTAGDLLNELCKQASASEPMFNVATLWNSTEQLFSVRLILRVDGKPMFVAERTFSEGELISYNLAAHDLAKFIVDSAKEGLKSNAPAESDT